MRFLSEIVLKFADGKEHTTTGITEFIAPKALKHRWLNRLSDLRTGKNGKGPLLSLRITLFEGLHRSTCGKINVSLKAAGKAIYWAFGAAITIL